MTIKLTHLGAKNCVTGPAAWADPARFSRLTLRTLHINLLRAEVKKSIPKRMTHYSNG